jgi:thiamine pyrophosphokinase
MIVSMMLPNRLQNNKEWVFVGPMGPLLKDYLSVYPVVAVDGGAKFVNEAQIWVGDGDSSGPEGKVADSFHLPEVKDHSDFAGALALLTSGQSYKIHLWGFLGGRRDHELFNLGEAMNFLQERMGSEILFYDCSGRIVFYLISVGTWRLHHQGMFSLGTLRETQVKLTGSVKYKLEFPTMLSPLSSHGLSNEGEGEMVLETMGPVFLYFPEGT